MAKSIVTSMVGHDVEKQGNSSSQQPSPDNSAFLQGDPNDSSLSPRASSDEDSSPTKSVTGFRWFLICLGTFSANVLYGLDTTIAADIQGAVSESFDNVNQLGWLGVGFTLGSTVAILPLGTAYAMFDTKWLFIGCLVMFTAGSALCGASPNMNSMILGRVWAGAGGAGMYLGTLTLVSSMTTVRQRAFYNGLIGFVYGGGCILGPIVGGSFADSAATWRWAFYLNLVLFGVMSPIYIFALPSLPRQADRSWTEKLRKLDWVGVLLIAALHVCFVLAFSFGGSIWAWSDGRFIALVVLFIFFTAVFAITQHFALFTTKTDRLFPCDLLGSLQLVLVYVAMACGGAALFVSVYYIPLFFIFVNGDTGVEAAVRLLPFVCFYVTSILICGYAMPRTGYHFLWYLVSGLLLIAGGATMYILRYDSPAAYAYGASVLLGLGLTVSQAGYDIACRTAVAIGKGDKIPEVLQFINISQGQSQLLGLTIASSIFQSVALDGMKQVLSGTGFSETQIQSAIAGIQSEVMKTISGELRIKALEVIVHAIDLQWVLVIIAGTLQTFCALFMSKKRFPLDKNND